MNKDLLDAMAGAVTKANGSDTTYEEDKTHFPQAAKWAEEITEAALKAIEDAGYSIEKIEGPLSKKFPLVTEGKNPHIDRLAIIGTCFEEMSTDRERKAVCRYLLELLHPLASAASTTEPEATDAL